MVQGGSVLGAKGRINWSTYATVAEQVIEQGKPGEKRGRFCGMTTSKLRGIYGLIMNVYTKINTPQDWDRYKNDVPYIRVKMAYEAGRDRAARLFLEETLLMDALSDVNDYDSFMLYCRYAESLVAYFKFYGGRD